jgi:hypothetical protein
MNLHELALRNSQLCFLNYIGEMILQIIDSNVYDRFW